MKYKVIFAFLLIFSSSVSALNEKSAEELTVNTAHQDKKSLHDKGTTKLRARIKYDQHNLAFALPKKRIFAGYKSNEEALSKITKSLDLKNVKVKAVKEGLYGESEEFEIDVNIAQGTFYIISKYEDMENLSKTPLNSKSGIDNDSLFKKVEQIINDLGIQDAESCHLAYLGMQGKEIGGQLGKPAVVSRKVFIDRTINEIPVLGNRLVLTFDLDGKFRKLAGRWTPINVKESTFTVSMNYDEIVSYVVGEIARNYRIYIGRESGVYLKNAYIVGVKEKLLSEMSEPQPLTPAWVASMDSLGKDGGLTIKKVFVVPEQKSLSGKL